MSALVGKDNGLSKWRIPYPIAEKSTSLLVTNFRSSNGINGSRSNTWNTTCKCTTYGILLYTINFKAWLKTWTWWLVP